MLDNGTIQRMQRAAVQQQEKENILTKPVRTEILSRKKMSGENKYSFCPYCLKDGAVSLNNKEQALFVLTVKEVYRKHDGSFFPNFETQWHCNKCSRNLTTEDFVKHYVKPAAELYKQEQV